MKPCAGCNVVLLGPLTESALCTQCTEAITYYRETKARLNEVTCNHDGCQSDHEKGWC